MELRSKMDPSEIPPPEVNPAAAVPGAPAEADDAKLLLDQLLRLKAEFENYRRRTDRERAELVRFGRGEFLCRLLPLYDLLLTAHAHLQDYQASAAAKPLADGMEMIFKEFNRLFESEGIRPIECAGRPYDPGRHEVLGAVATSAAPEGTVVEELERGYLLGDKVLRPARVKIAKPQAVGEEKRP